MVDGGADDVLQDGRVGGRLHPHDRGVGPHSPGVRPLVLVVSPLVVLGREERQDLAPVRDDEDGCLPSFEALLYDDPLPGGPELAGERGPHGLLGLVAVVGDGDALARGGAVGLHDNREVAAGGEVGQRRRLAVKGLEVRGGDAGLAHELLGEDLGALDAGGGAGGAEDLQACLPEALADAPDQGGLGSDHGQVYLVLPGKVAQGDEVVHGDVRYLRYAGYAGVAGGGEHLGGERARGQGLNQGVLPPPAADDHHPHGARSRSSPLSPGPARGRR